MLSRLILMPRLRTVHQWHQFWNPFLQLWLKKDRELRQKGTIFIALRIIYDWYNFLQTGGTTQRNVCKRDCCKTRLLEKGRVKELLGPDEDSQAIWTDRWAVNTLHVRWHFNCPGFSSLPSQVYRRSLRRGFEFSLMVVGESGLGKSTLVTGYLFHYNWLPYSRSILCSWQISTTALLGIVPRLRRLLR